jgi:hypothetical protein
VTNSVARVKGSANTGKSLPLLKFRGFTGWRSISPDGCRLHFRR